MIAALLIACVYFLSRLSKSTRTLRIFVESVPVTGQRASIVNDGFLPVFVDTCETVSDAMEHQIVVLDAIQRWRSDRNSWDTVLKRERCDVVPLGVIKANFTRKLLWPRQTLHTTSFFPNVGFPGSPFQHGDKLRFLLRTRTPKPDSESLSSPEFLVH